MPNQPSLFGSDMEVPDHVGRAEIGARVRGKALNPGRGMASFADYTLNAYVGCGFGCTYCFATAFVADEEKREAWGEWVDVKERALEEIARKRDLTGKRIFMSSATDPYQPLEAKIGLTRSIVELLATRQPYLIVQTRGPLVTRDIDLFRRFDGMRVNMSVTTDDDEVRRRFEPACASIDRRFAALEELKSAGIPIGVSVSPMLPITNPRAFARRIKELGPRSLYSQPFLPPGREFAASTRPLALPIAKEMGWGERERLQALREMREVLPDLVWGGRE
ncbi:MAG: SPL family radical SAM protein [Fimbriimonas sp.]